VTEVRPVAGAADGGCQPAVSQRDAALDGGPDAARAGETPVSGSGGGLRQAAGEQPPD
jgi:hypothetical protein